MSDPITPFEWQTAMDIAYGAIVLDSARRYGLVRGGPEIDLERCEELYQKAKAKGHHPSPGAIDRFVQACLSGFGRADTAPEKKNQTGSTR